MAKKQVFYSFHFENDVMRVQAIRNIGVLEGNMPVSVNEWEKVRQQGDPAIESWIDDNMNYKNCVIVLVGQDTANRKWVRKEIQKAWVKRKGLMGIYIHNIRCPREGVCGQGPNPFDRLTIGSDKQKLSSIVKCYNPNQRNAYLDIANNIESWIEEAIQIRNRH